MPFQVQYQHTGVNALKSEIFQTFWDAQAFALRHRAENKAGVIAILEVDKDGNSGQVYQTMAEASF